MILCKLAIEPIEKPRHGASDGKIADGVVTCVRPELLESAVSRPALLSIRSLWEYLGYLRENGLDDKVYQEALWEKLLYPFTVFALVLVYAFRRSVLVWPMLAIDLCIAKAEHHRPGLREHLAQP